MTSFLEIPQLEFLTDWIESIFAHQGILIPILLLAVEESGIPLPIPGDVMIAYSGYNISQGLLTYPIAFLSLMIAVLGGSSILYWLSFKWGNSIVLKFGRYLHLHPERLLKVENNFRKYGVWVIIFGRHIPGFRIPITVFAGMSGIKYRSFILATLVSTVFWVAFYLDLGTRLGSRVKNFLRVSSSHWIMFLFVLLAVLVGFIIYQRSKSK